MVEKAGVPMKVYKTLDRRAALQGADFVTTQLRVGQLKAPPIVTTFNFWLIFFSLRRCAWTQAALRNNADS